MRENNLSVKKIISLLLELSVSVCAVTGVCMTTFMTSGTFMGGATAFLYFTVQSNVWIGAVCLVFFIAGLAEIITNRPLIPRWLFILKYVFTVSITLTGLVFCLVLAPTLPGAFSSAANVLTHVVVPAAAIADLFIGTPVKLRYIDVLWALVPPVYYLFFSAAGFVFDWDFGGGNNYPYFFLNWNSPVGAFGFGGGGEYFMGSFYWVIIMIAFISAVSAAYIAAMRKIIGNGKNNN